MLNNTHHLIFLISAPSGTGKTTLIHHIIGLDPTIALSVSHTTRKPREGEIHGKDYYFITLEEFHRLIEEDAFLEWAKVHGEFYGTSKSEINRLFQAGKDVVLDIDVQGATQVMERLNPDMLVSIFIQPPDLETIRNRLVARGKDSVDQIKKRLKAAENELTYAERYTYRVVNDDLQQATQQLLSIIIIERKQRLTVR